MGVTDTMLEVQNLKMYFPITSGLLFERHVGDIKAVDNISFDIKHGETFGLVGESGCGKSTLGRAILQIYRPTEGKVLFEGEDLTKIQGKKLRETRKKIQMIFQDPYSSLNPRADIKTILSEPLDIHNLYSSKEEKMEMIKELMNIVGLRQEFLDRHPHEFSGGQRQRIVIARALAIKPKFIVCDEPIAALDVSIQAQIINLMQNLQEQLGLTYLFIAHDLSVVQHISDRIAVMYLGKIVEIAKSEELYQNPLHPYTEALISAVPIADPLLEKKRKRLVLKGDIPSPRNPPSGCNFSTRCPYVMEICCEQEPELNNIEGDHWVACYLRN